MSSLTRRPLAVVLAAVALALMLALGAVQPAHADGKPKGTWGTSAWSLNQGGDTLTVEHDGGGHRAGSVATAPWNPSNPDHADMTKVKKIVIGTAQVPVTFEYGSAEKLFANLSGIETIDLTHFDTSVNVYDGAVLEGATNMASMFSNCVDLTTLKLGNDFDTSRVTDMANMFSGCSKLATLDVSKFDTSRVTNMSNMFSGCSKLTALTVSKFDTSRVANMSGMFSGCEVLSTLDVSSFDTSLVESMGEMFSGCKALTSLNVTGFDTSRVTNMELMFAECSRLGALDVTGFNTSGVTTMNSMFRSCGALSTLDVSSFDTALVTDMGYMFNGCSSLTFLDLSNFAPSKMSNMESMFKGCAGLVSLNLSGFATSNQTNMGNLFSYCTSLSAVRLGKEFGFNDSSSHLPVNVTNAAGMGYSPSLQWIDPKGEAHTPDELNPFVQGAGWYLIQLLTPNAYAFFDWGVRGTPPTFVMATNSPASDPGQMDDSSTPAGWVDAAGDPVTFPVTVAKGSAVALSATWDKQPFSISDYTWSCPTDTTYDGKTHQATVKPKNAFVGAVTNVRYVNSDGSASASSPKDAGTYEVLFDVVGNASYVGADDVFLGSFTINKIKLEDSLDTLRVPLAEIYDGTMKTEGMTIEITGGNIVPAEDPLTAIATVTYPGGNDPTGSGEHYDAKVTDIQLENPNYVPPAIIDNQKYTVGYKHDTRIEDFSVVLPGAKNGNKAEYNGQPQPAVIKPKDPSIGLGAVTVKYADEEGTPLSGAPKDVGTYQVSFDVAESGTCYDASFGADEVGTFTIEPRTLNSEIRANLPSVVVGSSTDSISDVDITLEGGNILASDGPLKATATVTYGVTDVVATGVEEATVTDVKLTAVKDSNVHENYKVPNNYKLSFQAYDVTRKTPTADDFDFTPPTSLVYDGTNHAASVAPKTGIAGMGVVTEYYTRTDGEPSAPTITPPKDAGTYQVTFAVTEGTNYKATTENLVADTFTIAKCALNKSEIAKLPPVVVDSTTDPVPGVSIELSGGAIVSGESLTATATVTHPATDTVATSVQGATVTNVELKPVSANYEVPENYQLAGQSYAVTPKLVPTIDDFTVTAAAAEYDGQAHAAGITPTTVGVGEALNVRYFKGSESTPVNPVDAGTYTLKFDVKETATHAAATDLVVTEAVKINPRVLDANMAAKLGPVDQDTFEAQQVDVVLTGGRVVVGESVEAIASKVTYPLAGAAGDHADATVVLASLKNASNYTLPAGGLTLTSQSYTVNPRPANYSITEGGNGSWQQGSAEGLRFVADVELSKLKNVSLNGALLDSQNYTAESGSTIVTLKPAYLATLATGSHTLRLAFTDGAAETTFTVAEALKQKPEPSPEPGPGSDPVNGGSGSGSGGSDASALAPTGDPAAPFAPVAAALAALAVAGLAASRRARRSS